MDIEFLRLPEYITQQLKLSSLFAADNMHIILRNLGII